MITEKYSTPNGALILGGKIFYRHFVPTESGRKS